MRQKLYSFVILHDFFSVTALMLLNLLWDESEASRISELMEHKGDLTKEVFTVM